VARFDRCGKEAKNKSAIYLPCNAACRGRRTSTPNNTYEEVSAHLLLAAPQEVKHGCIFRSTSNRVFSQLRTLLSYRVKRVFEVTGIGIWRPPACFGTSSLHPRVLLAVQPAASYLCALRLLLAISLAARTACGMPAACRNAHRASGILAGLAAGIVRARSLCTSPPRFMGGVRVIFLAEMYCCT